MTTRRYLVAIPLLVIITVVCVRHRQSRRPPVARPMAAGMAAVEQAAQREAQRRLAQMSPLLDLGSTRVGKFSAETIHSAEDNFRHMVAVRGLITQEKERRILAQQILAMPDGHDLMREILLDVAFAKKAFGEFQSEARFYAIAVLDEVARQGNIDFVVGTATELAGQLIAVGGEPDRGRSEDLVSIAEIVSRKLGSRALVDTNSPLLIELGFSPDMPYPVRSLFVHGFFQGVWMAEGIENAQATIKRLAAL